jgi:hypothetical protein
MNVRITWKKANFNFGWSLSEVEPTLPFEDNSDTHDTERLEICQ